MTYLISNNLMNHPFFDEPLEFLSLPAATLQSFNFTHSNYEVYEQEGKFYAKFNVPGYSGVEDIKAEVDKKTSVLKIESKKSDETQEESDGRIYHHRGQSTCKYQIKLPSHVNLESASAQCESGQLTISFDLLDQQEALNSKTLSIPIESVGEKV